VSWLRYKICLFESDTSFPFALTPERNGCIVVRIIENKQKEVLEERTQVHSLEQYETEHWESVLLGHCNLSNGV